MFLCLALGGATTFVILIRTNSNKSYLGLTRNVFPWIFLLYSIFTSESFGNKF